MEVLVLILERETPEDGRDNQCMPVGQLHLRSHHTPSCRCRWGGRSWRLLGGWCQVWDVFSRLNQKSKSARKGSDCYHGQLGGAGGEILGTKPHVDQSRSHALTIWLIVTSGMRDAAGKLASLGVENSDKECGGIPPYR
jgi:hypothetical protein